MIAEPFKAWWCCLRPQERDTLTSLAALWLTNPTYVDRAVFDVLVVLTGLSASSKELAYFVDHYSLEYQDIPCGEDCVIHAVVFTDGFWPLLVAFIAEEGAGCAKPCTILTFPL